MLDRAFSRFFYAQKWSFPSETLWFPTDNSHGANHDSNCSMRPMTNHPVMVVVAQLLHTNSCFCGTRVPPTMSETGLAHRKLARRYSYHARLFFILSKHIRLIPSCFGSLIFISTIFELNYTTFPDYRYISKLASKVCVISKLLLCENILVLVLHRIPITSSDNPISYILSPLFEYNWSHPYISIYIFKYNKWIYNHRWAPYEQGNPLRIGAQPVSPI